MKIPLYILIQEFLMLFPSMMWLIYPWGNWDFEISVRNFLVLISATVAVHSGRNSLGKIPLLVFKSSSFFASPVCYEGGIRNIIYICLNWRWSRPFWCAIKKNKSNDFITIFYFSFCSELRSTKCQFCSPLTPLHPFLYLKFLTGGTRQKADKC